MEMFFMSIKVVGVLIFVIILMLLTLRLSENKLNNKKNIKVLDKAQLSKDNSIYILKILNKGYVVSVSSSKTDILSELSEDEIEEIENNKKEELQKITDSYNKLFYDKLFKESKNIILKIKKRKSKWWKLKEIIKLQLF